MNPTDPNKYIQEQGELICAVGLHWPGKLILWDLLTCHAALNWHYVPQTEIARTTGLSLRSVNRWIRFMEREGYLAVMRSGGKCYYRITLKEKIRPAILETHGFHSPTRELPASV